MSGVQTWVGLVFKAPPWAATVDRCEGCSSRKGTGLACGVTPAEETGPGEDFVSLHGHQSSSALSVLEDLPSHVMADDSVTLKVTCPAELPKSQRADLLLLGQHCHRV